ncbi:hypothetical protein NYQ83_12135 [Afifella sp. JA880]|uniref:hypothetical protein n=1 Tax=Afifella sp. JA880 TaxID=2975280 RepID=UPI0021BADFE2|nr:hypothetical protein [Afifella sp. JA880]MCT8268024.1 hypothetical protein [Afifella sp. JA880]
MKLNFTEFSYGYAFTENLIRWSSTRPTAAPVFPNLVQEAQLGYDIKINFPGLPLFFQFKLPERMTRHTAREIAVLGIPGLSVPFFRMPLMRRDLSDQHAHLIRLESRFPGTVFYTSPGVDKVESFNQAYRRAEVHVRSVFFPPQDIGPLPDSAAHSVAYSQDLSVAWFCSEPKRAKPLRFEDVTLIANRALARRSRSSLDDTVGEIREGVWSLLPPAIRSAEGELRQRIEARRPPADGVPSDDRVRRISTELLVLRELTRVGLGVDLLIAQP